VIAAFFPVLLVKIRASKFLSVLTDTCFHPAVCFSIYMLLIFRYMLFQHH